MNLDWTRQNPRTPKSRSRQAIVAGGRYVIHRNFDVFTAKFHEAQAEKITIGSWAEMETAVRACEVFEKARKK